MRPIPTLTLLLASAAPAIAQRMPLPDGSGRQLQLFDLERLCSERGADPRPEPAAVAVAPAPAAPAAPAVAAELGFGGAAGAAPAPPAAADALPSAAARDGDRQALAALLTRFVEPSLGPGDDFQVLAGRWLALLASAEQIASLERLLRSAEQRREQPIDVEVRLLQVGAAEFATKLQPRLTRVGRAGQTSFETVVDAAGANPFAELAIAASSGQLAAPRLLVAPLRRATLAQKEQTSYMRDFTLTRTGEAMIADPVIDVVWDGWEAEVFAAPLPDGTLGLACSVTFQEVEKPIAKFETTVPGGKVPLTIQLPRVTGTRMQQTAVMAPGALVVVAAQKLDGTWLVALVRASLTTK